MNQERKHSRDGQGQIKCLQQKKQLHQNERKSKGKRLEEKP
jgi:hypothetical protein